MPNKKNSLTRKLFKSGSLLLVGLALELGISFFAKVLMAQLLGAPDYGIATIGITALSFASTILLFGMNTGVGRYLPRFDDPADRKGILVSAFQVTFGMAVGASALLFVFADAVATHVLGTPEATKVLRIAAIGIPFATLLKLSVGTIQGLKLSLPKVLIRNIGQPIVRFVLIAVALVLGLGSQGILGAYTLTFALAGIAGTYYVFSATDITADVQARMRRKELVAFSAPLMLTATMIMVLSYFDIFLLSYFRTSSEVGTYNVIYPLSELLTATLSAFSFIAMPILSELHGAGDSSEMQRMYKLVTKWIFVLTLPLALVMILFPSATIRLTFGAEYASAGLPLTVLAVGFFTHAIAGPNVNTLTSIGRTRTIMYDNILAGATNIGLNIVLIPEYGILGAAAATAIAYGGLNVLYSTQLYRATGIHPVTSSLLKPGGIAVGAILVVYFVVTRVLGVSVLVLASMFALFVLIYGVAVLTFGGIEEEEVMILLSFEERFDIDLGPLKTVARIFLDEGEF